MKKGSINRRIIIAFVMITSLMLLSLGILITVLFNKNYTITRENSIKQQLTVFESSITSYLNQEEDSYDELAQVIDIASASTDVDIILTDDIGYVYMVSSDEYENLKYSRIDDIDSLSDSDDLTYIDNTIIKDNGDNVGAYIKPIFSNENLVGYIIVVDKSSSDYWGMIIIIWIAVIIEIFIATIIISIFTKKTVVKPIKNLNNAAKRLAKGEVGKRVEVNSNNEMGELAESFNIMAESIEKSDKTRSQFISNVSHEFRSPITSIKGFVGAILDGVIPKDKENYYLKIVYDEIDRLARLVNDLLDMSAMESGKFNLAMTEFDVNQVISLCTLNLENKIKAKGLNVKAVFHNKRSYVLADRDRIIQVVTNLIENAIKYSYDDGDIEINVYSKSDKIYVSIFNSGDTIAEEDINKIWERFYKTDKSRTNKISTGLGLPVVRLILSQHNEDVWVENVDRRGVKFTFTLEKSDLVW